ncbi:MAG: sodium:alanine symporter family protein, partial [Verrucomicrobia bacterium]|nr:sodium:alanine symporter family protein [Verrucomicrobiota bacterium]
MFPAVFDHLSSIDSFFWGYIAFVLIILLGCWLTIQARFFQIRAFPPIIGTFIQFLKKSAPEVRGVHPIKAFFASVGGMIGIGNVVGIVTAVQIGGPGALFWVWVAAFIGMIIKYSEIFLGITHRVHNDRGGYDGGPMYFLRTAFKNRLVPIFISILLCIYGVEIYQFAVVTDTLAVNFDMNRYAVIGALMALILYASVGGVSRIGKICSWIMPGFIVLYIVMSLWVIVQEAPLLPGILASVFVSAFTGHAAIGGFVGSSAILAIQHGISRAAYSADIGIGYDSIIQSESNTVHPERQARLAVLGVCVDNLICTMSILVVLASGVWKAVEPIEASRLVQTALSRYFPYMDLFMPIFLLIVGYSTMIAYFCVGIKCARFLSPAYGERLYLIYGVAMLFF